MARMRGDDRKPNSMFSYVSPEQRVPKDHPLGAIRAQVDAVLGDMSREFDGLYATVGRPSIPPERLLRAQLLQTLYLMRSDWLLMERLDYTCCSDGTGALEKTVPRPSVNPAADGPPRFIWLPRMLVRQ